MALLLDWAIGGAIFFVLSVFVFYRLMTRLFDWGPVDS
jgi:hypothetical protein